MTDMTFKAPDLPGAPVEDAGSEKQTQTAPESADLATLVAKQVKAELDRWNREQQGLRKKVSDRITRETDEQLKSLKETGIDVSDQQAQAIQKRIRQRLEEEFPEAPEPQSTQTSQPAPEKPQTDEALKRFVQDQMRETFADYGVTIYESDPESKELDNSSPSAFLRSLKAACVKKAARANIPVNARMPSSAASSYVPSGQAALAELQRLLEHPTKADLPRIQELRKKVAEAKL